eukprot:scaffold138038_cov18-Tisochrysis_lutea.AAC.1
MDTTSETLCQTWHLWLALQVAADHFTPPMTQHSEGSFEPALSLGSLPATQNKMKGSVCVWRLAGGSRFAYLAKLGSHTLEAFKLHRKDCGAPFGVPTGKLQMYAPFIAWITYLESFRAPQKKL